jgi:hypothetical protein
MCTGEASPAPGVAFEDGELTAGDRGVEDDCELGAAAIREPLVLGGLADVGLQGSTGR